MKTPVVLCYIIIIYATRQYDSSKKYALNPETWQKKGWMLGVLGIDWPIVHHAINRMPDNTEAKSVLCHKFYF